jgi:tetratricopeptide (TPR) repeat protein
VVKDGNLLHFQPGAFERLLHDGLVLSQQERLPVEALRRFRQATVLHPESYLPELFCARVSSEPISPLTSALQKNPHSIRAHLDLSSQLFKRGEIAKAVNLLLSAAQLFPSYELPYQKTIPILESLGAKDEAIDMQHRVSELLKQIGC